MGVFSSARESIQVGKFLHSPALLGSGLIVHLKQGDVDATNAESGKIFSWCLLEIRSTAGQL